MKYQRGTFVVVPNKEHLKGKPSELQTIFMWLCDHSDDDGVCYPSRRTLAKESGCGLRSVDKYLLELEQMGLIEKTLRQKPNSKENTSNLYQINVLEFAPPSAEILPPSSEKDTTPSIKKDTVTIPNTNSTQLTVSIDEQKKLVNLPIKYGKTPIVRLIAVYSELFRDKYGFAPQVSIPRYGKQIKAALETKTEIQLAVLMIIFFGWNGMDGSSDFEGAKLTKASHPLGWFFASLNTYEAFARNVSEIDLDNPEVTRNIVARTMTTINQ